MWLSLSVTFKFCANANWRMGNSLISCFTRFQVSVQGLSLMLQQIGLMSCDSHMDKLISTMDKHSLTGLHLAIGPRPTASLQCHYKRCTSAQCAKCGRNHLMYLFVCVIYIMNCCGYPLCVLALPYRSSLLK